MQSGSTGINAFRIDNPVKQSRDQVPTGAFIRQRVPEQAARSARQRLRAAYRGEDAAEASQAAMARHGRRKRRPDGVRSSMRPRDDGQLGLF